MATVKVRKETRFEPVPGTAVEFLMTVNGEEMTIHEAVTDSKGVATAEISGRGMINWDSLSVFEFAASAAETESTRAGSRSISIKKARLSLTLVEEDSLRRMNAFLEEWNESWLPVGDVEVKFQVRRNFGMLPAVPEALATNEEGLAEALFEAQIPGDSAGRVEIVALLEDHEEYGTLSANSSAAWGSVRSMDEDFFEQRALWASRERAPIWLLIFPNLILLGVWSSIVYVLVLVARIRRAA
jgi:hypothetical protein